VLYPGSRTFFSSRIGVTDVKGGERAGGDEMGGEVSRGVTTALFRARCYQCSEKSYKV
jgi:hypothetical protein